MARVTVRKRNGRWLVDASATIDGKRTRSIRSFGRGAQAMIAAEEYRDEIARQAHADAGRYWQRMTMNFEGLWRRFVSDELAGPDVPVSKVARTKALGQLYLLPHLGSRLLAEVGVQDLLSLKRTLQGAPSSEHGGSDTHARLLSPHMVDRVMALGATVWRYGRRMNLVDGNPFASVRKAKADPGYGASSVDRPRSAASPLRRGDRERLAIENVITHRRRGKS